MGERLLMNRTHNHPRGRRFQEGRERERESQGREEEVERGKEELEKTKKRAFLFLL